MSSNVLLLGRTGIILDNVEGALDVSDVTLFAGTSLDEVKATRETQPIDHVIVGAGIALEDRLAIIKHVFDTSTSTTVHMKDWDSGPGGMLPFVNGVLTGLASAKQLP